MSLTFAIDIVQPPPLHSVPQKLDSRTNPQHTNLPRQPWIPRESAKQRLKAAFQLHIEPLLPVFCGTPLHEFQDPGLVTPFQRLFRVAVIAACIPFLPFTDVAELGFTSRDDAIAKSYQYVKDEFESQTLLISVEVIQICLLLSFCCRRNPRVALPGSHHWLHRAIAEAQSLPSRTQTRPSTPLFKRIWWTCYLYERLEAFDAIFHTANPVFVLHASNMEPLTLDDFEAHTVLACPEDERTTDRNMDRATEVFQLASIHIMKIRLSQEIEKAFLKDTKSVDLKITPGLLSDLCTFHHLDTQYNTWRKSSFQKLLTDMSSKIALHWTLTHLMHCTLSIVLCSISQHDPILDPSAQDAIVETCIYDLAQRIVAAIEALFIHTSIAHAHATDPAIWSTLLIAFGIISSASASTTMSNSKKWAQRCMVLMSTYKSMLVYNRCVMLPSAARSAALFQNREGDGGMEVVELDAIELFLPTAGTWDVDGEDDLQNAEAVIYGTLRRGE